MDWDWDWDWDWDITQEDIERAKAFREKEKISPLTRAEMFRGALYCVLSASENYDKHSEMYQRLLEQKLDTPETISADKKSLRKAVKGARFPGRKATRIHNLAAWWPKAVVPESIMMDVRGERSLEFEIRDHITRRNVGLGPKCASLFLRMCGYENVVPVDIWAKRYLQSQGYKGVKIPDFATVSGDTVREYRQYEEWMTEIAKKHGFTPAMFQLTLWVKNALDSKPI